MNDGSIVIIVFSLMCGGVVTLLIMGGIAALMRSSQISQMEERNIIKYGRRYR